MRPLAPVFLLILLPPIAAAQTVNIFGAISGPEASGHVTATVKLSAPSASVVTVDYATVDDTAKAGVNYTATSDMLTFNPGETTKTVDIPIFDNDVWGDGGRQFLFTISNPTGGATLGNQTQIYAVIADDDPEPVIEVSGNVVAEGSGTRTIQLQLTKVGKTAQSAIVAVHRLITPVEIADLNGLSVQVLTTNVTFSPSETQKFVDVSVTGNNTYDGAASHTWTIVWDQFNVAAPGTPVTLVEDDPMAHVTVSDVSVIEGTSNSGNTLAHVTFTADRPVNGTIDYSVQSGTAMVGVDFLAPPFNQGRVRFAGNEMSKTADIEIIPDSMTEPDETFTVDFSNVQRMSLDRSSITATIVDDDSATAPARVDFSPAQIALFAGQTATITATLTPARASDTALQLETASPMLVIPDSITIPASGATTFAVTAMAATATQLTATAPPDAHLSVGSVEVDVANPTVSAVTPFSVPAGVPSEVTVSGNGFSGMCHVTIDGVFAPTRIVSDTTLSASVAAHAAGSADVAVVCAAATVHAPQPLRFAASHRRAARH